MCCMWTVVSTKVPHAIFFVSPTASNIININDWEHGKCGIFPQWITFSSSSIVNRTHWPFPGKISISATLVLFMINKEQTNLHIILFSPQQLPPVLYSKHKQRHNNLFYIWKSVLPESSSTKGWLFGEIPHKVKSQPSLCSQMFTFVLLSFQSPSDTLTSHVILSSDQCQQPQGIYLIAGAGPDSVASLTEKKVGCQNHHNHPGWQLSLDSFQDWWWDILHSTLEQQARWGDGVVVRRRRESDLSWGNPRVHVMTPPRYPAPATCGSLLTLMLIIQEHMGGFAFLLTIFHHLKRKQAFLYTSKKLDVITVFIDLF